MAIEKRLTDRYRNDPAFHNLVDSMTAAALKSDMTPQDFVDAMRLVDVQVRDAQLRRPVSGRTMTDYRIKQQIVPDDGADGIFYRNGERWLREDGQEYRLLDLAPSLESKAMMEEAIATHVSLGMQARNLSLEHTSSGEE